MRRTGDGVPPSFFLPLLFLTILLCNPLLCSSFTLPLSNYRTLFSLSNSLFSRVANLREARGDYEAAFRARSVARKLDNYSGGFSFWKVMWDLAWDYGRNYAWNGGTTSSFQVLGALSEFNELISGLSEFSMVRSDKERVQWVNRNYENLFRVSKSLFGRFRDVFRKPGPIKELMEALQKEVVEGDLLRDCLELGSNDLKGLLMCFRDISEQYTSWSDTRAEL